MLLALHVPSENRCVVDFMVDEASAGDRDAAIGRAFA